MPMICGSRGSRSLLTKAAGAEPCGQMRDEKLHAVVARSTPSQNVKSTTFLTTFGSCDVSARWSTFKLNVEKVRSTFRCQNCEKNDRFGPLLRSDVVSRGRRNFLHFQKTMAGVGHSRGSAKMHFAWQARYKNMFIRDVRRSTDFWIAFSSIRSIRRDRRSTSYDLASLFRRKRDTLDK